VVIVDLWKDMIRERPLAVSSWPIGAALLAAALALAGCEETKVVSDTAKVISRLGTEEPKPYKIGNPYKVNGVWYYPKVDYDYNETGIASWYGPGFNGKNTANGETYDENALTAAHKTLPLPTMVRVTNLENGRSIEVRINDRGPYAPGRIIDMSRRGAQLLGFAEKGTARVRVQVMKEDSQLMAAAASAKGGDDMAPAPSAAPSGEVTSATLEPIPGSQSSPGSAASGQSAKQPTSSAVGQVKAPEPDGTVTVVPVRTTSIYIQAGAFLQQANAHRLESELSSVGPVRVAPVKVGQQRFYRVRIGPIASVEAADQILLKLIQIGHPEARIVVD
jgi:rare lipoprotein A